ncbi:MAG: PilZ domain-containing protein [Lachnospiraceae bacterium]|nr:PilZ domain-containing protein [Lachnospiraceae bacterium]
MLAGLNVGDKVDIVSTQPVKEGERKPVYLSQIVDIENSTQLKIIMPTLGTRVVPLEANKRFNCTFYTSKGLYAGDFVVIERSRDGSMPVIKLEIRTALKKVQRREYYRYDCMLPMKYRIANKDEKISLEELKELQWFDGVVVDLSGGGMRFVVPASIPKDAYAQFKLVLEIKGAYKEFYLYGDIISARVSPNNNRVFECRTQFMKITEAERDQIIGYIFEQERKKRNSQ